ncbi:hypothetical protein [Cupriavidus sp. RAF12]
MTDFTNQFLSILTYDPATGALSQIAGSPFPLGISPTGMALLAR